MWYVYFNGHPKANFGGGQLDCLGQQSYNDLFSNFDPPVVVMTERNIFPLYIQHAASQASNYTHRKTEAAGNF